MKKKICIIEDDPAIGEGLQHMLEDEGFNVCLFSDGKFLERIVDRYKPDLFLIDYRLPGKDGIKLTKIL